jgi:hypothetical protein
MTKDNPLLILFGLFILGGVLWWNAGGPNRPSSKKPVLYIEPANTTEQIPLPGEKQTNNNPITLTPTKEEIALEIENVKKEIQKVEQAVQKLKEEEKLSKYNKLIKLDRARAQTTNPEGEYLIIRAQGTLKDPATITGWSIKSLITGRVVLIGKAANFPFLGRVNTLDDISLKSGEKAIIITGESPTGISFRLNQCTGYFEQFQNWIPSLPQDCPKPQGPGYYPYPPNALTDKCLDYIDRIPRCIIPLSIPNNLESACFEYINQNFNYTSCTNIYKNTEKFYKNEWRIYLGLNEELWKTRREVIELRDSAGLLVDNIMY